MAPPSRGIAPNWSGSPTGDTRALGGGEAPRRFEKRSAERIIGAARLGALVHGLPTHMVGQAPPYPRENGALKKRTLPAGYA
jgi:hypothetical protein